MDRELLEVLLAAGLITEEQLERFAGECEHGSAPLALEDLADEVIAEAEGVLVDAFEVANDESTVTAGAGAGGSVLAARRQIAQRIVGGISALRTEAGRRYSAADAHRTEMASLAAAVFGTEEVAETNGAGETVLTHDRPRTRPEIGRVAARRPARHAPRPSTAGNSSRIVSSRGHQLEDLGAIAAEMVERHHLMSGTKAANFEQVIVASIGTDYPEDRRLSRDDPWGNVAKIDRLRGAAMRTEPDALTAAGGLCAPAAPRYDVEVLAGAQRPVRDALLGFQADRGAISYRRPPTMGDATAAVGVWTVDNDAEPGSDGPATKPVLEVPCEQFSTAEVQAITRRLRFGNFRGLTDPEGVQAWVEITAAEWARLAEEELIDAIRSGSTQPVSTGQNLGAARDLFAHVDHVVGYYRTRHRLRDNVTLQALLPNWVHQIVRTDLARQHPGDRALGFTDGEIDALFRVRGIAPSFYIDEVPEDWATQGIGALDAFPSTVAWGLWAAGSWLHLDAGTLDLGIVRDPGLNDVNQFETFFESLEGAARVGLESIWVTSDLIPSGTSSAAVDPTGLFSDGS